MKKHIPNSLTCSNLICGCIATLEAYQQHFGWAFGFIVLGAVFDFFDGFVARLLHVSSPMGKELDSLADNITFGFAPATIIFSLLQIYFQGKSGTIFSFLPYIAFLVAAFSALRLAKFNLDTRQSIEFIGLPTPANALFWASLGVTHAYLPSSDYIPYFLIVGIFMSSWALVCEIPMFSLKFKTFGWKENQLTYLFMIFCAIILILWREKAFVLIIPIYVIISILRDFYAHPSKKV